jgi:hypothetical protein
MNIKRKFNDINKHIEILEGINEEQCILLTDKQNNYKYCLLRQENKLIMKRRVQKYETFDYDNMHLLTLNQNTFLNKDNDTILITESFWNSSPFGYISFNIYKFESENFQNKNFFQLIFKSNKKLPRLDFVFDSLINVSTEKSRYVRNGLTFAVKDIRFNLYFVNQKFVIENIDHINFSEFDGYSRVIVLSFGFLFGYVPRGEGYYFAYENNDFKEFCDYAYSDRFIDTYQTHFRPIDKTLFYSFIPSKLSELERKVLTDKYEKNLILISEEIFSNLCNVCLDERKILRAIELIMEGNQTTVEAQGIVYSVVLEILTSYITNDKNSKSIKPIDDKVIAKELKKELHSIAKAYVNNYKDSAIKSKIDNINTPTNRDKLTKPFDLLNIPLNKIDKKIINHRNDFLHGNDFIEEETLWGFTTEHIYINHKLHFLIHALLLKIIGHHGKIINIVKLYAMDSCENCQDEEIYRDIGENYG